MTWRNGLAFKIQETGLCLNDGLKNKARNRMWGTNPKILGFSKLMFFPTTFLFKPVRDF